MLSVVNDAVTSRNEPSVPREVPLSPGKEHTAVSRGPELPHVLGERTRVPTLQGASSALDSQWTAHWSSSVLRTGCYFSPDSPQTDEGAESHSGTVGCRLLFPQPRQGEPGTPARAGHCVDSVGSHSGGGFCFSLFWPTTCSHGPRFLVRLLTMEKAAFSHFLIRVGFHRLFNIEPGLNETD